LFARLNPIDFEVEDEEEQLLLDNIVLSKIGGFGNISCYQNEP
jgi:hypothetical protein